MLTKRIFTAHDVYWTTYDISHRLDFEIVRQEKFHKTIAEVFGSTSG